MPSRHPATGILGELLPDPLWIFGYGSLLWRPDFAFVERRPAGLAGFARRFWQGSTDHRGLPGAPGRVVTLVPEAGALCRGLAFRVDAAQRARVLAQLDHRERGGFERRRVELRLDGGGVVPGLSWVAGEGNPNYLGPAPLEALAEQVRRARGPSGHNREYVLELARSLRELGADDGHVFALERLLRKEPGEGGSAPG